MTTLGRAYVEIVADGGNFKQSLRQAVGRDSEAEMSRLGRQGGDAYTGGYKATIMGSDADRAVEDLGKRGNRRLIVAGESGGKDFASGVGRGVKVGGSSVEAEGDRLGVRLRNRFRTIGDDSGRILSTGLLGGFAKFDEKFGSKIDNIGKRMLSFAGTATKWSALIAGASYGVVILGEALLSLLPILLQVGGAMVQLSGIALGIPAALGPLVLALLAVKLAVSGFGKAMTAVDDAAFNKATQNMGAQSKALASELRGLMPQFRTVQQAAQDAFSAQVIGNVQAFAAAVIGPLRAGFAVLGADLGRAANQVAAFLSSAQGIQLLQGWFDSADIGMQALTRGLTPLLVGFANLARVTKPIFDGLAVSVGDLETRFGNWLTKIAASGQAFAWLQAAVDGFRNLGATLANLGRIFVAAFQASGSGAKDLLATLAMLTGGLSRFLATAQGQQVLAQFFDIIRTTGGVAMTVIEAIGKALLGIAAPAAQVAAALGPGLTAIINALGQALVALAPALVPLFAALSSALITIAPMLPQLASAFADLIIAVAPLIPMLAPLVAQLGIDLANALQASIPLIRLLIAALGPLLANLNTATIWEAVAAFVALRTAMAALRGAIAVVKFAGLINDMGKAAEKCGLLKGCDISGIGKGAGEAAGGAAKAGGAIGQKAAACGDVEQCGTSVGKVGDAAGKAVGPLSAVGAIMARWGKAIIAPLITLLGLLSWEIIAVIAAIALMVVAVILLIKHWDQVVAFFKRLPGYLMEAVSAIGGLAATIGSAIVGFFAALPGQIGGFLVSLGSTFISFVTGLPGMLLGLLSGAWSAIWGFLQSLPGLILQGLMGALQGIAYAIGAGLALIVGIFILLPIKLVQILVEWIPKIIGFFSSLPPMIIGAIIGLAVMLASFFTGLMTTAFSLVSAMISGIVNFFIALPGQIWTAIIGLVGLLVGFFTALWTTTLAVVSAMISGIVNFFIALPGWIMTAIVALPGLLFAFFTWIWNTLVAIVSAMFSAIVSFFTQAPGWIMGAIAALPGMLAGFFTGIWNDLVRIVSGMIDAVVGFFASLPGKIGGALAGLAGALEGPFKSAANAIFKVINSIIHGFNDVITKFPGGSKVDIPDIPLLARGGVIPGTGNKDTQLALLTPGEGVLTVSGLRRLGGKRALDALNRRTSRVHYGPDGLQRFGFGGIVGAVKDAATSGWAKGLGIGKELLKMVTDPAGFIEDFFSGVDAMRSNGSDFADRLRQIPVGIINLAVDKLKSMIDGVKNLYDAAGNFIGAITSKVGGFFSNFFGGGAPSAGGSLGQWIAAGMAITGVPSNWAGPLTTLIMRESGGNPNSINLWDINAQNGDPSRGLMQTIGSTFAAYRDPSLPNNIYDPVANIVAGIRYILATYGTIFNVQQAVGATPMGYDLGGIITSPQLAALHAGEVVIPLSRTDRAVSLANQSGLTGILANRGALGQQGTVINAPITVNAPQSNPELVAWNVSARIARLAASGVG